jgi:hypothetical protein
MKLQTHEWEVNVRASASDFASLGDIRSAEWATRRTLQVGESAGAPVFWATGDDRVTLMVGHDDETWDIALTLPVAVVDDLVQQVETIDA